MNVVALNQSECKVNKVC